MNIKTLDHAANGLGKGEVECSIHSGSTIKPLR